VTDLVACDLDRTLIYSPRAFWLETSDALAPPIIVAELYQGVPISFMTRSSEVLLLGLQAIADVVPVTTRTVVQYRRVQLPGPVPHFAVTSNGGVILNDGEPDPEWSEGMRVRLQSEAAPLEEVRALLTGVDSEPWILKVNTADELFVYAIIDREAMPPSWSVALADRCNELGWTVSVQGRKLYCVPRVMTKSAAVAEVARRLGSGRVLAAGDSLLDRPMLEAADLAFRPAHGELHDVGYEAENLRVTRARGILAGEELLRSITKAVGGESPVPVTG
jgi:hypothetical protein